MLAKPRSAPRITDRQSSAGKPRIGMTLGHDAPDIGVDSTGKTVGLEQRLLR